MKKVTIILLLLVITLIPFNVNAASIKSTSVTGANEKTVGEEFYLSFAINFSDIKKGTTNGLGIWLIVYEIDFDDTVFTVTNISSSNFDSAVFKENGKYYVLSEVSTSNSSQNKCADGVLYCADYLATLKFFVKDTDKESSIIKMGKIEAGLFDMSGSGDSYLIDDMIMVTATSDKSQTIKINKSLSAIKEAPISIIDNSKPKTDNKPVTKVPEKAAVTKSNNKYLKSLEIENYEISFDKTKNDYEINIEKGINKLDLKVELEDSKATYKILGADDLETNNYKVSVEVTAENGEKNTYNINAKIVDNKDIIMSKDKKVKKEIKKFKIDKKYIIIGGTLLSIVIIIAIIVNINDRRKEKALDNL